MMFNDSGYGQAPSAVTAAPSLDGLLSWQVFLLGGGLALFLLSKRK